MPGRECIISVYLRIGAMLGGKQDRRHPERVTRVDPEPDGLEIRPDEPAHKSAAPKQLLKDGYEFRGAEYPEDNEHQVAFDVLRERTLGRTNQRVVVVKQPVAPIRRPEHVRCDPQHEH